MTTRLVLATVALLGGMATARAAGCNLDELMHYQIVFAGTVQGYGLNGKQTYGFEGCEPGRVLIFTDRTGLRCKGSGLGHAELPKAWLFARSKDDMKLCVGDTLYDVEPLH
jgi:hypothetical protein